MPDTVEIIGLNSLIKAFEDMPKQMVKKCLHDALNLSGTVLQTAAAEAAPILTGQLEADIRKVVKMYPAEGQGIVAVGPSQHSFYGWMQEFGTSKMPSRPWFRPAFDRSYEEAIKVFDEVLDAYIAAYCKEQNSSGGK